MKILVLNYEYPPVGGGGGRLCEKLCEELVRRGHCVRVVTAGVGGLPKEEMRNGVHIARPPSHRRKQDSCTVSEMGLYLVTAFPEALRQVRKWQPDVIHAHFIVPTGVLAFVLNKICRIPYVVTAHLGDVPGGVPEQTGRLFTLVSPFAKLVWQSAAARTAVSHFVARLAESAFLVKPQVIPNGIPAIPPPIKSEPHPKIKILMVGRLSIQKNPLLAVRALSRIRDLPWAFDVVGEGPLFNEMQFETRRLLIDNRCHFFGWLTEDEVRARMREADILLMTSLHEGLPMAAVEALWHGLALVGTQIGGLEDVIKNGKNGFLCSPTPKAISKALAHLINDPTLRQSMSHQSLLLAKQFDFSECATAYEKCLTMAGAGKHLKSHLTPKRNRT